MTEVLFYHLTERTLKQTLPGLLEKCAERNWKSVVQFGVEDKLAEIDTHLWNFKADSFLAHSSAGTGNETDQPVLLTCDQENLNGAEIRFMVEGAVPPDLTGYTRGIYIFDGHNEEALTQARTRWKVEKEAGHEVTYWQQKSNGGWEKKA